MTDPQPMATECLTWLHDKALQIEHGTSTWCDNGFTWAPGPVVQTVRAEAVGPDTDAVRLQLRTQLLRSPEAPPAADLDDAQQLNTLSALAYVDGATSSTFELLVYPELLGWQLTLASWVAAVQLTEAANILSALPLGRHDFRPEPDLLSNFDSIVDVGHLLARRSFEVARDVLSVDVLLAAADVIKAAVEPAVGPEVYCVSRPWTALPPEAAQAGLDKHQVLSYVGLTEHPHFGPGFGIRSFFPLTLGPGVAAELLSVLNTDQHGWIAPRVGAWLAAEDRLLVQTFLPAGLLEPGEADILLGNVLSYHERMMRPGLEVLIDR